MTGSPDLLLHAFVVGIVLRGDHVGVALGIRAHDDPGAYLFALLDHTHRLGLDGVVDGGDGLAESSANLLLAGNVQQDAGGEGVANLLFTTDPGNSLDGCVPGDHEVVALKPRHDLVFGVEHQHPAFERADPGRGAGQNNQTGHRDLS